jgi:hypothetical protein
MITQCLYTLDYPGQQFGTNVQNGVVGWTVTRQKLSTDNYSSSSFWKATLPPYRETIDIDDNSIASPDSFHSIEDDGERDGNQSTQDDMIMSNSIVNLKIK